MEIPDKFYRVSAKALVFDNQERILLLKETGDKGWELPGGGIEFGESPQETIIREVKEECGFLVGKIDDSPMFVWSQQREKEGSRYWALFVGYRTTLISMEDFIPSDECEEYRFVPVEEIKNLKLHPNIKKLPDLLKKFL